MLVKERRNRLILPLDQGSGGDMVSMGTYLPGSVSPGILHKGFTAGLSREHRFRPQLCTELHRPCIDNLKSRCIKYQCLQAPSSI
jgi:hypothetical protein